MRVLLWSDVYAPQIGGIETVVAALAKGLTQRGHIIEVLTCDDADYLPGMEQTDDVTVHRLPLRAALNGTPRAILEQLQKVAALKRQFEPDVVHLHFRDATCLFELRTRAAFAAPLLVTFHAEIKGISADADTLFGQLLKAADWITAVSHAVLGEVHAAASFTRPKSSVIYNATAMSPFEKRAPVVSHLILAYGRHVVEKGFDILIDAMPTILAARPEARLVLASDGPERAALEMRAAQLGVAASTTFPGFVSERELDELRSAAAMIIVPSRWNEGFGMVALEAAVASKPVVAARSGGLEEVVIDGVTGLLIPREAPEPLAQAVIALLDDPARAARLGAAARAQAERRFSVKEQLDAYEVLYRRLVDAEPVV